MGRVNLGRGPVVVVLLAVGALLGAVFGSLDRAVPIARPTTPETLPESPTLEVHVAGWVLNPGVVTVPEGSIIADAVAAAGGLKAGATTDQINLAAALRVGDQVFVPGPHSDEESNGFGGDGTIALNRAGSSELEGLPGVGPVLAERIVAFREEHGPFGTVEDLLQVPGIGEAKLASIRDLVRVP